MIITVQDAAGGSTRSLPTSRSARAVGRTISPPKSRISPSAAAATSPRASHSIPSTASAERQPHSRATATATTVTGPAAITASRAVNSPLEHLRCGLGDLPHRNPHGPTPRGNQSGPDERTVKFVPGGRDTVGGRAEMTTDATGRHRSVRAQARLRMLGARTECSSGCCGSQAPSCSGRPDCRPGQRSARRRRSRRDR